MTTEAVLLMGLFVFLLMGAFLGENGPRKVFARHAPRLAARVEAEIATGRDFNTKGGGINEWSRPTAPVPKGTF